VHIAVVYREGRPQLYLNGQPVHAGMKSRYQVHSSLSIGDGPSTAFRGELAGFQEFGSALPDEEITRLGANRPQDASKSALTAITLSRGPDGKLVADLAEAGPFNIVLADGKELNVTASGLPAPMNVEGEWTVSFPAGRDVPETINLPALGSLTGHTNEAIRYFAGTATFTKTVELPAERLAKDDRVMLDLGRVEALAEVVINGRNLGVFWKPPFVVDITSAARAGDNTLEIRVTGTWRNRLIGAAKYPNGFSASATGKPEFQPYTTADLKLAPDAALSPFGLIGPVKVRTVRAVSP
jgi:hypothetical protein